MTYEVYFPITANILTPGHIKCLKLLAEKNFVVVGVLTAEALKGYKDEIVPFKDRFYILKTIVEAISGPIIVVPQNTLNPEKNIKWHGCNAIASGDGWEKEELNTIKKLKLKKIDIKLKGEKSKTYSSSKIWNKRKKS